MVLISVLDVTGGDHMPHFPCSIYTRPLVSPLPSSRSPNLEAMQSTLIIIGIIQRVGLHPGRYQMTGVFNPGVGRKPDSRGQRNSTGWLGWIIEMEWGTSVHPGTNG